MSEPVMKETLFTDTSVPETLPEVEQSRKNVFWSVFKKSKLGMFSLIFLLLTITISILAPIISPYDPINQNAAERMLPPSGDHWLGTDAFGRDILSRIIYGSQTSLLVGFISVLISSLIGTALGMVAALKGGLLDDILMRILESIQAIPMLLLGLMLLVALGSNTTTLIIAISLGLTVSCARVARGPTLELKEKEFVRASISYGASTFRIIVVHILPNILGPVLVMATLHMASAIRVEASLSFLGLGIQPPHPTWGNMIQDGLRFLTSAPWVAVYPGVALMVVVIAFNIFGDTLRDAFDPHIIRERK
ncbi:MULTISPECIES: ABC transporter permease [Neobacillus]|uniref:ABC transporter permease n=1 Tax=Neobacillus rhizophilus TaxID=2833579 RepID=A0A942YW36_9BACI|nr:MULTISPECIES: ABC transporter permease [Neobacillus]MBS4214694.1 ABC transporter permease [Neobacillus rhizophilus]